MNGHKEIVQFVNYVGNRFGHDPKELIHDYYQKQAVDLVDKHSNTLDEYFGKFQWVLVGSANLACRGLLPRKINDLDIVTVQNYYKPYPGCGWSQKFADHRWNIKGTSGTFFVGDKEVNSFKLDLGGICVDVFHTDTPIVSEMLFTSPTPIGVLMQVEKDVISAKRSYVNTNLEGAGNQKTMKHRNDLDYYDNGKLFEYLKENHPE